MKDLMTGMLSGALVIIGLIALLAGAALWYALHMPGWSHRGPVPPASVEEIGLAASLKSHVVAIASRPHNVGHHEALEAAAVYIEQTLGGFGYAVTRQAYEADGLSVRNLEVTVEPADPRPDTPSIVIGAHYDSAGDAPGANDNGSGVAAVIELARLMRGATPKQRLRFVLFVNEEPPYFQTPDMGSMRYAAMLAERREPVSEMLSLETIGYFSDAPGSQAYPPPFGAFFGNRGNFIAFVGMPGSRGLVHRAIGAFRRDTPLPSIGGVAPGAVPGIGWSDHWAFAQHGFPAIMVTDTAPFRYPHYHLPTDTPDRIDYERLARVTLGLQRVIRDLAE